MNKSELKIIEVLRLIVDLETFVGNPSNAYNNTSYIQKSLEDIKKILEKWKDQNELTETCLW